MTVNLQLSQTLWCDFSIKDKYFIESLQLRKIDIIYYHFMNGAIGSEHQLIILRHLVWVGGRANIQS